jgi:hypothetical protein
MEKIKSELEKLPLYSLRKIGRESGVKAPTELNKSQLIDEIIKVKKNEVLPIFTNRGRPHLKEKEIPIGKTDFEIRIDEVLLDIKEILLKEFELKK